MQKTKKTMAGLLAATVLLGTTSVLQAVQVEPVSAASDPVKIMAMGDSITDGYINQDNGYRKYFCYWLQQNGITNFDMVGSKSSWSNQATYDWNGTTITYDPDHSGYSGYTIQNIGSRQGLQETIFDTTYTNGDASGNMMEAYQPDVIMLQIGTNDILDAQLTGIGDRLEELVDKLLPYVSGDGQVLYLASIPDLDVSVCYSWLWAYQSIAGSYTDDPEGFTAVVQAAIDDYNTTVKNLVAEKQAEGAHIEFSDINSTIDVSAGDLQDGVHPNEQGYAKMGQYWSNLLTETYFHGTVTPTTTTTTTATTTTTTETTTTTTTGTTTATDSTPAKTTTSAQTTTTEPKTNPSGDSAFTLTDVDFDTKIDLSPYSDITSIDVIFSAADGASYNGSVTFDGWNEATSFTSTDLKNQTLTVTPSKDYDTMTVHKYFGDVTLEKVIVHTKGSTESTITTKATTTEIVATTTEAKTTETSTTTTPAVTTTIVTTGTEIVNGDVNGDGTADLTDLVLLQKYLVRRGTLTAEQSGRADLNADHVLNVVDAMLLRQLLLKNA